MSSHPRNSNTASPATSTPASSTQRAVASAVRFYGGNTSQPQASSVFRTKPDLTNYSAELENAHFIVGQSTMQGWRSTLEDAHQICMRLDDEASFFGVFDGHGGQFAAIHASQNIVAHIRRSPHFATKKYAAALRDAYISLDAEVIQQQEKEQQKNDKTPGSAPQSTTSFTTGGFPASPQAQYTEQQCTGCTGCCAIFTKGKVICANVGDSRAVLCRDRKAADLSVDHKPSVKSEQQRIKDAGGEVKCGRVNGLLAMTRAFGDACLKDPTKKPEDQVITCVPEIKEVDIESNDSFVVLACDGVWDCLSSQEVVNFFLEESAAHRDTALMCENLCLNLVAPTLHHFGTDNMTVVCCWFRHALPEKPDDEDGSSKTCTAVPKLQKVPTDRPKQSSTANQRVSV